ncbi:ROK family transcriptional regulator [Sciscionella sediminilitoris]|uniref:ROK family transcriptional regulator n=1 Tax=Sciscionella sediminilitoris TaxID=1445613 RepID=UPI0004DF6790|nr:ROK family transcriptional regulator [Sciscionella sp. SE31]
MAAEAPLISPTVASEVNRARIMQALYDTGPLSRAELARLTGVSRATIGSITGQLIDNGLLAEGESRPSSAAGGKPSRPLWFAENAPPIASAHLLPGTVEAALISAGGTLLAHTRREYDVRVPGGTPALEALTEALTEIRAAGSTEPMGIGVAIGGMVDTDSGSIVHIALAPALDGLPVAEHLRTTLGLPTWIDVHPRVQALGDRWFGQGRGRSGFASLYTGEALGVGLVIGGSVHRGPGGTGGEVGHTTVDLHGKPCHCGRTGCWETIATHTWLRTEALEKGLPGAATLTAGPLARLAARDHPHAAELLDEYARNLAIGMANLHQTFAPGLFILHGDAVAAGETLRGRIEHHLHRGIPPHPAGPPQVAFTNLDDHATLLGAAGLVLSHTLHIAI